MAAPSSAAAAAAAAAAASPLRGAWRAKRPRIEDTDDEDQGERDVVELPKREENNEPITLAMIDDPEFRQRYLDRTFANRGGAADFYEAHFERYNWRRDLRKALVEPQFEEPLRIIFELHAQAVHANRKRLQVRYRGLIEKLLATTDELQKEASKLDSDEEDQDGE